jgi:hypothetical protein
MGRRLSGHSPVGLYLGLIALLTALLAWPLVQGLLLDGTHGWPCVLLGMPIVLVSSQLAISLVNWLATIATIPRILPRMDYADGLPPSMRSLVAVPAMLASEEDVEELVEGLEVRFLANRDAHLHFALLTDFIDAATETLPQDARLLALAKERIDALNTIHADAEGDRFFLFHRPRRWNPTERAWMGRERKRGKLADLNAWLRGGARGCFSLIAGRAEVLRDVRYVITLDADTQLPRDSARGFVGAMAHPLNRPVLDAGRNRARA